MLGFVEHRCRMIERNNYELQAIYLFLNMFAVQKRDASYFLHALNFKIRKDKFRRVISKRCNNSRLYYFYLLD